MNTRPYILKETNWKSVKETNYKIAILPWGATEAHNYHLPFGTDIYESEVVSEKSAKIAWEKGVKVIVLPTIPFGVNTQQLDIKLTINLNPSTQMKILNDIIKSLEHHGIDKLVILNSHGGNDFKHIIRELQPTTKIYLSTINWFTIANNEDFFDEGGDHANEMETSLMLCAYPDLVLPLNEAGVGKAKKFRISAYNEKWAWAPREWSKVTNDTGIGNPEKANAEKGEKFLNFITEKIAEFLIELSKADISDMYE
jgi:creatinine amidohydrolase